MTCILDHISNALFVSIVNFMITIVFLYYCVKAFKELHYLYSHEPQKIFKVPSFHQSQHDLLDEAYHGSNWGLHDLENPI